ncbi:MAG TPA: lysophospholipase [Anaeromyxobacteraceae bacterium]|nr:lysophospholipase [Anaeromyxobacteraceae bacterium]
MSLPSFPGPDAARRQEGFLRAADGLRLYWQRYTPEAPRSTVMVLHGAGDHSGRYPGLTDALVRTGHEVALLDFRGHGQSDGRRWYVDQFEDYLADLEAFAASVRAAAEGRPLFVVAHSQGGHIAAHWGLRTGLGVRGFAMSSPFLRLAIDPPKVKVWASLAVGKLVPFLPVDAALDFAELTADPEMQRWTAADPLYLRKTTPRWFTESGRAQEVLRGRMGDFAYPLLVMVGSADHIADPEAGKAFLAAARSTDKSLKVYEGFRHELFNEVGRSGPIGDAVAFVSDRAAGSAKTI